MHDSIFEREVNLFSIKEIYLMGGFRSSYLLIPFGFFSYHKKEKALLSFTFTEIKSSFPVPFWDYVADCLWLRGMVSISLIRKGKYEWFLHEGRFLDWLFFSMSAAICLLFKIFCQDNKFFILKSISSFPTSVCSEASQNLCYCNGV